MKHLKYILLGFCLLLIAGFATFSFIDVPVKQSDIEIKIPSPTPSK